MLDFSFLDWGYITPIVVVMASGIVGYQYGILWTTKENFRVSIQERMSAKAAMDKANEILERCRQHEADHHE